MKRLLTSPNNYGIPTIDLQRQKIWLKIKPSLKSFFISKFRNPPPKGIDPHCSIHLLSVASSEENSIVPRATHKT